MKTDKLLNICVEIGIFFRTKRSKEQHLFYITKVFTVTSDQYNASLQEQKH